MFTPQSNEMHASNGPTGRKARFERLETLPKAVVERLKENPAAGFALVGAASFLLGGLLGSKLGRLALAAALPLVVVRMLEGRIGSEMMRYVEELFAVPDTGRGANA